MPQNILAAIRGHDAGGVQYVNTLAFTQDVPVGPDTALDYSTMADDIWVWLAATYLAMLSPDYTVDDVHVVGILGGDGEGTRAAGALGTLAVGGATGHTFPKELALVITWKTAHAGRTGRGRIFVPSPGYASFGADRTGWLTSGVFWGGVQAFVTAVTTPHTVAHGGIDHRYTLGVYSRADNTIRAVTAGVPRSQYHWLRSRSTAP